MIVIDCEEFAQQSREWYRARLGIVTASGFSKIVTSTGRLSGQRDEYAARLLAEWALGEAYENEVETYWTDRGKRLEPKARRKYEYERDTNVREIALAYRDEDRLIAASPDALAGDYGLVEIKCPTPHKHLLHLALESIPREYRVQLQAQLWVTGRAWVDWVSWSPDLPVVIRRELPNDDFQKALDKHIPAFVTELLERRQRLTDEHGIKPWQYDASEDFGGL